jgi:hypothetical protein
MPSPSHLMLALLLLAPVALRYQYKPGRMLRFKLEQGLMQTIQVGDRPAGTVLAQKTTMTVRRRVVSASAGLAVVEEVPADGEVETQTGQGTTRQVVQPIARLYTYDGRGRCVKVARRAPPGLRDPGVQFLEGFSLPLSDKPVAPGGTWTGTVTVPGPDRKPIRVVYSGRYVRDASHLSHPCAEIQFGFTSAFAVGGPSAARQGSATLKGTAVQFFARDLGQDVDVRAALAVKSTTRTGGGVDAAESTNTMQIGLRSTLLP